MALLVHFHATAQRFGHTRFRSPRYTSYIGIDPIATVQKKPFQRYSVGLTYVPVSGSVTYHTIDENDVRDTGQTLQMKGYGVGAAYSIVIPCARTGTKSVLAINVGLNVNFYRFNVDDITLRKVTPTYNGTINFVGGGAGFMVGLPVSVDLITGGEATLDRADRFSFCVGGGLFPMVGVGIVQEFAGAQLQAPFLIKAEAGFHFGINWKVRATYITKSATSFTDNSMRIFDGSTTVATDLKSNDQFMISLMVQPFSFGWD